MQPGLVFQCRSVRMYSVVIADGQDLVRLGLRSLLRTRDDIDLISSDVNEVDDS